MWYIEACEGLRSIFLLMCISLFFFFLPTTLLFKHASEHLNDQKCARRPSAAALSNSGRMCFSNWERWTWTIHIHSRTDAVHAHVRTHTRLPTHPASLLQTGERLSAYPAVEPCRKVEKCAPQWRCSQSYSCPKPAASCLAKRPEGKRPESFYSTFTHSSSITWGNLFILRFKGTTCPYSELMNKRSGILIHVRLSDIKRVI